MTSSLFSNDIPAGLDTTRRHTTSWAVRPRTEFEFGTAYAAYSFTAIHIAAALKDNGMGQLYTVDLHKGKCAAAGVDLDVVRAAEPHLRTGALVHADDTEKFAGCARLVSTSSPAGPVRHSTAAPGGARPGSSTAVAALGRCVMRSGVNSFSREIGTPLNTRFADALPAVPRPTGDFEERQTPGTALRYVEHFGTAAARVSAQVREAFVVVLRLRPRHDEPGTVEGKR
ncbi:class I SAM-dependent methyltransferase [Streptomyces sp. AC512_CC834]|uniref:class I SAM-dependent methyltransferase n=1 Tax=Streptomyces sp. AC512_CC834 TaxID=2823691 RepID=UPI001C2613E5|nr:class I SAM-dependent methyltransferase [Streptomyces sp. AC512_CC834]